MKKTSRRKFGKQLTTALAILPAAALVNQPAFGQKPEVRKSLGADVRTSHNTPPDVVVSEGSLNIESHDPFRETPVGNGKFDYAASGMPQITHIRVLQDNGDKIYEDIEGITREVRINWEDNVNSQIEGTMKILNDSGTFKIKSDKQLQGPGNAPPASHRRFKYGHPGNPNRRMRIRSIDIVNESGLTTTFTAPTTADTQNEFMPHEFRILIWRH
jgi:hypothetical protein